MSGSLDGVRESLSYKAEATGYGLVATCGYSGLHSEASEWGRVERPRPTQSIQEVHQARKHWLAQGFSHPRGPSTLRFLWSLPILPQCVWAGTGEPALPTGSGVRLRGLSRTARRAARAEISHLEMLWRVPKTEGLGVSLLIHVLV